MRALRKRHDTKNRGRMLIVDSLRTISFLARALIIGAWDSADIWLLAAAGEWTGHFSTLNRQRKPPRTGTVRRLAAGDDAQSEEAKGMITANASVQRAWAERGVSFEFFRQAGHAPAGVLADGQAAGRRQAAVRSVTTVPADRRESGAESGGRWRRHRKNAAI